MRMIVKDGKFRTGSVLATVSLAVALFSGAIQVAADDKALPAAFSDSGASTNGEALFQTRNCGFCHEKGGRKAGKGPQLMHTKRTPDQVFNVIQKGRPSRGMPSWARTFTEDEIWEIVAYIKSLKPLD